jgi:hypothetical protein
MRRRAGRWLVCSGYYNQPDAKRAEFNGNTARRLLLLRRGRCFTVVDRRNNCCRYTGCYRLHAAALVKQHDLDNNNNNRPKH